MEESQVMLGTKLVLDGHLYQRSKRSKGKAYWDCVKLRNGECTIRAITADTLPGEPVVVFKNVKDHPHAPDQELCKAEIVKMRLKRRAEEHPEQPPAQILRSELPTLEEGVLSQLPERENLKKAMRRQRQKNLPPNPISLDALQDLPERYRQTLAGETFLIYDSLEHMPNDERVLVFSTRRNLELLSRSSVWFLDGTFKVAPHIFTQIFTILGLVNKNVMGSDEDVPLDKIALPLVFALMSSKESSQYTAVLNAVKEMAEEYRIQNFHPERIMTDFEMAILTSCPTVFEDVQISCCFFHLGQTAYRRVQSEGLQTTYNDPLNRGLKRSLHMMLSLAYVPPDDVKPAFQLLLINSPHELGPVLDYFAENYVLGRPARGRRRQILPRYPIELWNQYEAALQGASRTNNVSEGWHNRFAIVVGKHHPDLYSLLTEIQKEQADTECAIAELSLGRSVRAAPKKKWYQLQRRIQAITASYANYKRENRVLDYLKAVSYNIVL